MKNILLVFAVISILLWSCEYENKEQLFENIEPIVCTDTIALFALDIVPILEEHCNRCHRNDRQDGGVNLEGFENVKTYADDGSLYGSTNHEAGYEVMPTSGIKIPFCEIEKMRLWIEAGAQDN